MTPALFSNSNNLERQMLASLLNCLKEHKYLQLLHLPHLGKSFWKNTIKIPLN